MLAVAVTGAAAPCWIKVLVRDSTTDTAYACRGRHSGCQASRPVHDRLHAHGALFTLVHWPYTDFTCPLCLLQRYLNWLPTAHSFATAKLPKTFVAALVKTAPLLQASVYYKPRTTTNSGHGCRASHWTALLSRAATILYTPGATCCNAVASGLSTVGRWRGQLGKERNTQLRADA